MNLALFEPTPDQLHRFLIRETDVIAIAIKERLIERKMPIAEVEVTHAGGSLFDVTCQSLAIQPHVSFVFGFMACFDGCLTKDDLLESLDRIADKLRESYENIKLAKS